MTFRRNVLNSTRRKAIIEKRNLKRTRSKIAAKMRAALNPPPDISERVLVDMLGEIAMYRHTASPLTKLVSLSTRFDWLDKKTVKR